tara:strand:- start:457 stop:678 length:222 start_codon:yes stop_codon:yes gene_type:complete
MLRWDKRNKNIVLEIKNDPCRPIASNIPVILFVSLNRWEHAGGKCTLGFVDLISGQFCNLEKNALRYRGEKYG